MSQKIDSLIPIIGEAARSSGDLLRRKFSDASVVLQDGRDIKLEEDKRSEALILEVLLEKTSLGIVSEEAGWARERKSDDDLYWAVDPLDGSYNFAMGIPLCATSVALCRGFEPLAGGVYDFLRDEWTLGGEGLPLTVNGRAISRPAGQQTILSSGIPISSASNHIAVTKLADRLQGWRKLRMIGSAALSLSWVARGRFDGYMEDGIRWWDVAGGLALVKSVGGQIRVEGTNLESPLLIEARVN